MRAARCDSLELRMEGGRGGGGGEGVTRKDVCRVRNTDTETITKQSTQGLHLDDQRQNYSE